MEIEGYKQITGKIVMIPDEKAPERKNEKIISIDGHDRKIDA